MTRVDLVATPAYDCRGWALVLLLVLGLLLLTLSSVWLFGRCAGWRPCPTGTGPDLTYPQPGSPGQTAPEVSAGTIAAPVAWTSPTPFPNGQGRAREHLLLGVDLRCDEGPTTATLSLLPPSIPSANHLPYALVAAARLVGRDLTSAPIASTGLLGQA